MTLIWEIQVGFGSPESPRERTEKGGGTDASFPVVFESVLKGMRRSALGADGNVSVAS